MRIHINKKTMICYLVVLQTSGVMLKFKKYNK